MSARSRPRWRNTYLPAKVNDHPHQHRRGRRHARHQPSLYRAKPDGYTLAIFNIPGMFVLQQRGGAGYDLDKVTWLGSIGRDHYALGVGANSPIKTVADLKALAAQRPVNRGSPPPDPRPRPMRRR